MRRPARLDAVVAVFLWSASLATAAQAQTESREAAAIAISQQAFQLAPGTPSISRPFIVDATASFSVSLTAPSQTLRVALVAPNGVQYVVGDPAAPGFESGFFPIDSQTTTPGATYLGTVGNPLPGTWALEVSETVGPNATIDVVVVIMFDNAVRLVLVGGGDSFPIGADVRLALVLFDGATKGRNLTIQSKLFLPGDPTFSPASLAFADDGVGADEVAGDGIYEAFANPGRPGSFQVQADVSGTAPGGPFQRTAATTIKIVPRKVAISAFVDRGIDRDFDGLLNGIGIAPAATISEDGDYVVTVRLRGSNGKEIQRSLQATLLQGPVAPEVVFDTADIAGEVGVDGPYDVSEVRFLQSSGDDFVPADIQYDLGQTSPYSLETFQRPRLALAGTGRDSEFDLNGNGLFDRLDVSVDVVADFSGFYSFSASLTDSAGHELGFAAGSQSLASGSSPLTFSFAGAPIGKNGVDGPYSLSNLIVYGVGQSLIVGRAFTTGPLLAREFEGFVPKNKPPVAKAGGPYGPLEATSAAGAVAMLDGTGSSDPDGDPILFSWTAGGVAFDDPTAARPTAAFPLGATQGTLTVSDGQATVVDAFAVTVVDTTAPSLVVPPELVLDATSPSGAVASFVATASDRVDGAVSTTCSPASGSTFPVGATTVTCQATDKAGNPGAATFVVTVNKTPDARMYGIGHIDQSGKQHHFVFRVSQRHQRDYGRIEYWVDSRRCNSCNDDDRPAVDGDRDETYGRDHCSPLGRFESTLVVSVAFSDDPDFRPGHGRQPAVDTVMFSGVGTWNGRSGYSFEAVATDRGEPGRHRDTFSVVVRDGQGKVIASVNGDLDGGNIQSTRLHGR